MAGHRRDDLKGDDRWTIRIPNGQPADPMPEQREGNPIFPEVSPDALAAFFGQFQTADKLDEFLKNSPRSQQRGGTNEE